jgi:2-hydroxychromene-2-carboxylate isomerase
VDDVNISDANVVVALAAAQGVDPAEITAGMNDPAIKERLKNEVDAAIAAGVFGSPFIFVDGEPFWGVDRLDQVDRWLSWGGF